MESFLDEYQYVRLALSILGLILLGVVTLISGWKPMFPVFVAVPIAIAAHSTWSLVKGVRSPIPMLLLDLTLWGGVMALNHGTPIVNPGTYAFLSLLPILFANTYWTVAGLLAYLASWYGVSYFLGAGLTSTTIGLFLSVLITVAGIDAVILRIRMWLSRLDANRSQVLGTVSHELKNNLTGVLGMTELVTTQDDLSQDEAAELIDLAHQQALDATEIVEDLLTVSRLERAALSLEVQPVNLPEEVAATSRRFNGEGTAVVVTVEDVPEVVADPLRVRQILRNLISNAVRYGGENIEVLTRSNGTEAQVVVRDDGEGIPREDLSTIFLPYRRSTKTPSTGTSVGLGLYISRQLAEAMGGRLEHRRTNGWTEFILALRLRGEGLQAAVNGSPASTIPAPSLPDPVPFSSNPV